MYDAVERVQLLCRIELGFNSQSVIKCGMLGKIFFHSTNVWIPITYGLGPGKRNYGVMQILRNLIKKTMTNNIHSEP